jgi:hypothetical protein
MKRRELLIVLFLFVAGLGLRYWMTSHWCFAGADSYGYLKLSDELRQHRRLALGPDQPLEWARLPLYPMFLMVKGEAPVDRDWQGRKERGWGWLRIMRAQAWVDMIFVALLAWWITRRLVGPRAALAVYAFAVFSPFTIFYVGSVLTETLAIALSMAAVAPLLLWKRRWAFALSGALIGLAMLLRADSLLLIAALPPAAFFAAERWRARAGHLLVALACCAAVFHVWPIRNLHEFGALHPIGARIDRESRPLENVDGYWTWLRSFARTWEPTTYAWTCYYEKSSACGDIMAHLERLKAFDSPEEKARVQALLWRRSRVGLNADVDFQFARLAWERGHRRPLWVYVVLPLLRMGNMWVTWLAENIPAEEWRPHPIGDWAAHSMFPLTMAQFLFLNASLLFLLWRRETRWLGAIATGALLGRTLVLGFTAYCMPRYALELMPLGWIAVAAAIASLRTLRARPTPSS